MNSRKKIRVGVVGVGYLGKLHAEKYAKIPEAELVGVTDIDHARAREIASLTGTTAYPAYKDFFGHVDAVSVVTPTESHAKVGAEFLSRGIDVLMEKPIASNLAEADALIKEADRSKAVLQVGHLERFNAAFTEARKRITVPSYIEAHRLSPFPNRSTDVDVILDVMIHDIDLVLSLVDSEVTKVEASGTRVLTDKLDICNARLRFKNGCTANIIGSRAAREKVRRLNIAQSGSLISVDFLNQQLFISSVEPGKPFGRITEEEVKVAKGDSLLEEIKSFLLCSMEKTAPVVSGWDGRAALEVAGRIQEAVREGAGLSG
ncbi:MAG: Gfo/Idh/MocA family oxidoreductase [Deltaproteobacteria bacterium]|nr:Gfo/Idh/MocA family oxidoreductase [Deltaproteobacteria bacterium]